MIKAYADQAMEAVKKFNIGDYGVFKTCLICFGILIGVYANKACRRHTAIIWLTFLGTYIYLIYKLYCYGCCNHHR